MSEEITVRALREVIMDLPIERRSDLMALHIYSIIAAKHEMGVKQMKMIAELIPYTMEGFKALSEAINKDDRLYNYTVQFLNDELDNLDLTIEAVTRMMHDRKKVIPAILLAATRAAAEKYDISSVQDFMLKEILADGIESAFKEYNRLKDEDGSSIP